MKIHYRFLMLTIVACVLTSVLTQAQTISADSTVLNPLARKVQRYYNLNQGDSLYTMVSDSTKLMMTLDKMKSETNRMLGGSGQWKTLKFEEIKNNIAHYTATFENGISDFYLGLGKDGKLKTMLLRSKQ